METELTINDIVVGINDEPQSNEWWQNFWNEFWPMAHDHQMLRFFYLLIHFCTQER